MRMDGLPEIATGLPEGISGAALVYASRPAVPPADILLDIARVAEFENARHRVSGLLCHSPGRFVQMIEGPPAAVAQLWRNLQRDPRHRVIWMESWPVERRAIPAALPMGYATEAQMEELGVTRPWMTATSPPDHAGRVSLVGALRFLADSLYPVTLRAHPA